VNFKGEKRTCVLYSLSKPTKAMKFPVVAFLEKNEEEAERRDFVMTTDKGGREIRKQYAFAIEDLMDINGNFEFLKPRKRIK